MRHLLRDETSSRSHTRAMRRVFPRSPYHMRKMPLQIADGGLHLLVALPKPVQGQRDGLIFLQQFSLQFAALASYSIQREKKDVFHGQIQLITQ